MCSKVSRAPIRLAVVCDFQEEGWHSMDLIADMLLERLPAAAAGIVTATRLRPPMPRRWSRVPLVGQGRRAQLADRLTGRFHDYPRWLARQAPDFDVFHIVDQSYAHLVRVLPPQRTIVTCNDVDAVRAALPGAQRVLNPMRLIARPILDGLSSAARVACISRATRNDVLTSGRIEADRVEVVYLGVHPSCVASPDPIWDARVRERIGPPGLELLHVGSSIPRKRIDTLLEVFAGIRRLRPDARLIRVGDPFTDAQRQMADALGVAGAVLQLPFLERPELAGIYRRAALLLMPSEREGFGLPLAEAMACGTPAVASAIPALQEVGGEAAAFCRVGSPGEWVEVVHRLLTEREQDAVQWRSRRERCAREARRFDWNDFAVSMTKLYREVASAPGARLAAAL